MPSLLVEASRVAQTVAHGIHGRRRAGPGETFWQFRHYATGDSAPAIDWRRSASSDHLYIREREWEAAHTLRIWPDLSPSMVFQSHIAPEPKRDRALILAFAIGELALAGGERVGLLGGSPPASGRKVIQNIALSIAQQEKSGAAFGSLPPRPPLNRFSECILVSDFLDPPEELAAACEYIAGQGVRGHLIHIIDPAEETLPYNGRVEFSGIESGERVLAGRAEDLRKAYGERLRLHKEAIVSLARRLEWSYLMHHTDRPAGEALLTLHTRLSGQSSSYRARTASKSGLVNDERVAGGAS
ncbi:MULTISPECIES: DUF58 domain-containing protein [Rhodomicrobium]|uniref:DUF58 domain-containing protein n=1 Tax=Rhodomicrobium TaxID=1068 RepID=UPI001FD9AF79|nr:MULTISPECIES: DUF58 domain-containing protein [Rhodomicrobium]